MDEMLQQIAKAKQRNHMKNRGWTISQSGNIIDSSHLDLRDSLHISCKDRKNQCRSMETGSFSRLLRQM